MREEKEEIQQNLSTYPTLHVIKMCAVFSDRCLKNSHLKMFSFDSGFQGCEEQSVENSVILKVKSEVSNTAKGHPHRPISRLGEDTTEEDLK